MNMELVSEAPFLETEDIHKSFNHVQALKGVSMKAYGGEVLAIVGDNGAGKSTLIKILSGVLKPDCGIIRLEGKEYERLTPRKASESGISIQILRTFIRIDNIDSIITSQIIIISHLIIIRIQLT